MVSSPRVVTADQTKALIEQGTELPYQVATSSGATSIAFRKANLKLEVTPQITPEGNIILTLDVNKDTVGQHTAAGFAINTKHVQTEVLVENGGTVVIGGIFELTESNDESRVPVLGEVPYLGRTVPDAQPHCEQDRNARLHHAEDDYRPQRRALSARACRPLAWRLHWSACPAVRQVCGRAPPGAAPAAALRRHRPR